MAPGFRPNVSLNFTQLWVMMAIKIKKSININTLLPPPGPMNPQGLQSLGDEI